MTNKTASLFMLTFCLLSASPGSVDSQELPVDLIGKRYKLVCDDEVECTGVITQLTEASVVIADVSVDDQIQQGVPMLSHVSDGERLFTNIGSQMRKLDVGIVLPQKKVVSWDAVDGLSAEAEPALGEVKKPAMDVVGKRFRLAMKNKKEYTGVITQLTEGSVLLSDVSKLDEAETGVPMLGARAGQKLFTNVGRQTEKLDYGIVVLISQIASWHAISEEKPSNVSKDRNHE
jgi:hypothetical protein